MPAVRPRLSLLAVLLTLSGLAQPSACFAQTAAEAPIELDLLLQGGTVYDGDSDQPRSADIGIAGGRIVFIGPAQPGRYRAKRSIDASGMIVAPGFIDAHTHADRELFTDDAKKRQNLPFLLQGVTTTVIGNDGFGGYDIAAQARKLREKGGVGTNVAMYVGFGPIRQSQLGDANRAPDAAQLDAMKRLVHQAMCEGAIGLSTGLFYPPQNFAKTEEVIELAKVAAAHGGLYDSHIRDESFYNIGLKGSIDEVIRIGREAGLPVNVAHIKALGIEVQGQSGDIIRRIEAERAKGLVITADHYPWTASSTRLSAALVPPWAADGGRAEMLKRFDDPALQERLKKDLQNSLRLRGGADAILFSAGSPRWVGQTLAQVAQAAKLDPVDAAIMVLRDGDLLIASFNQIDGDVNAFMQRPWVMTSSDSSQGHPRAVATFARKYEQYVVKDKVISLAQFIRSSSSLTADTLGIKERGHLRPGYHADVVVFDPARYAPRATYTQPYLPSEGVVSVVVNGLLVIDKGQPTGVNAGQTLLRAPRPGMCGG